MKPAADFTIRAQQWLHSSDTGLSSEAIFHYMTLGIRGGRTPSDPSDLGRCIRLLERFPEWQPRMSEMTCVGTDWERLMPHWDEIVALYHEEKAAAVKSKWGGWDAHRTYSRMKEVQDERVQAA